MMVYKAFCDNCGKETKRNYVSSRFEFGVGRNKFQIVVATDGTWNDGVICLKCLRDAIDKEIKAHAD